MSTICLVSFERNRYSVSVETVGRSVQVRAVAGRIVMLQDGGMVGEHAQLRHRQIVPCSQRLPHPQFPGTDLQIKLI